MMKCSMIHAAVGDQQKHCDSLVVASLIYYYRQVSAAFQIGKGETLLQGMLLNSSFVVVGDRETSCLALEV